RMSFQRRKPRRAWEAPGGSLRARSPCHKACAACGLLSGRLLPCPSSARGPLCQVDRVAGLPHVPARSPSGGIGRRGRLKICCSQERAGSSPAWGTTKKSSLWRPKLCVFDSPCDPPRRESVDDVEAEFG